MGLSNRGKSNRLFDGSRLNVLGQGIKTILQGFFSGKKTPEYPNPGIASIDPTPTQTPVTPTPTPTTQTPTPTPTNTSTPSVTPTNTPTTTQTRTQTKTPTQTKTQTATQTKTPTQTKTQTKTPTQTKTQTQTPTQTQTNTRTQTQTPTNTRTQTPTNTQTRTQTPTNTQTRTQTKTPTQTKTQTPTNTGTPTQTKTQTPTPTTTPTPTKTSTPTPTPTKTSTPTKTQTPTNTQTQTQTKTPTQTATQTKTPTQTPTQTATNTQTPTNTQTQTPTSVSCFCFALDNTFSSDVGYTILDCNNIFSGDEKAPVGVSYRCANQITPYDSNILSISVIGACDGVDCPPFTPTPTPTNTATPTNTPTNTKTQTQTKTETPTNTATISQTPSTTPTNTPTPSITPTNTNTPTNTSTVTPTVTPTITETPTNTPTQTTTTTNTQTPTNTATPTQTQTQTPTGTCIKPVSLPTISLTSAWYSAPGQSGTEFLITPLNDTQACQQYQNFSQWFNPSTDALPVEVASYAIGQQIYNFGGTSCICNVPNGNYWTNALDPTLDPTNTSGVDIVQIFNCQIINIVTNCQSPIDTSPTPTPTTTQTPTQTQTQTPTKDETPTPTPTNTNTPTNTSTQTQTPTNTQTQTQTPTQTMTQTCEKPIGGVGFLGASRYYYPNGQLVNLLALSFDNSCGAYKTKYQTIGTYILPENLKSLYIYPGISEGTNVGTVFPLDGSSCFCDEGIQGNWWVNYTDPQAPPTQTSGIYWVSVDINCNATISACTISIPETPTPTPTMTQTPSQTITQTPTQTTTQTPTQSPENKVVLRSIAGRSTGITGTKGSAETFNITYDMGMGGGELLYNGASQTAVNLFSAQTQNNIPVLFKNPVISTSLIWNSTSTNRFKIINASAIEDNTLLFYWDKIGRCTAIEFTSCSFHTISNTFYGDQAISNTQLYITDHLSGLTINDSFWPQGFLTNTKISSFGFSLMKDGTTMELNFQSMTSMSYIGVPNTFPSNTGLTSVSINLPPNFGGPSVPTSFLSNSVTLGPCLFLTSVTFPNASTVVGTTNVMGVYISSAQRLLTIGNFPKNTQRINIEGVGNNEVSTLSLTSMTTDFSSLTKLTTIDITKTRLNSPNFPSGGQGIEFATLLTNLNLSANQFTTYPVLPPSLLIFNMGNNKFTASPSSNTYFPSNITDITLSNVTTNNSAGGLNNIPTWDIDFSNTQKLINFYLVQVGLTAWNPANVFPKTTKIVDLQSNLLLTTFNANCLSATTATTVVSLNLNNCSLTAITNLNNSGTLKELYTRSSRFANKNDISPFPSTLTKWDSQYNGVPLLDFTGKAFTANMNYLDMQRFGLNTASVDYILAWFANTSNNNLSNGTIKLDNSNINCSTANANCNAIPTNGNNNTSRLSLVGRGWLVTVRIV